MVTQKLLCALVPKEFACGDKHFELVEFQARVLREDGEFSALIGGAGDHAETASAEGSE